MLSRIRTGVAFAIVLLLAAAMIVFLRVTDDRVISANFVEAKGIYVGDNVTVLGVPVGKISHIEAKRDHVTITMEIDRGQKIPSDAKAAVVSKSLVSVRSIVIGPVYDGGPAMADGARIPLSRTTVPVEWDEVKDELVRLTDALGPSGANKDGATSDLITASSRFLDGKGSDISQAIKDLSKATSTLADNKGNTFATVRNLEIFVTALRSSDAQVREFEQNLARASRVLDANSESITYGIKNFKKLTTGTGGFFAEQGTQLAESLESLQKVTDLLADNRQSIADLLQLAPTALSNFYNILDPRDSAASGELALTSLGDPAYAICGGLLALGGDQTDCRDALGPIVQLFKLSAPPVGVNVLASNSVGKDLVSTPQEANILGSSAPKSNASAKGSADDQADLLAQLGESR